ncbi:MAG: 50S ribosomal protein L11 methyltransferase [Desulfosalsimonadaceae bacterium]
MKWRKTTVVFESGDPETAVALINDIFQGYGLKGVIEEGPDVEDEPDWAENAQIPPDRRAVIGFFPEKYHLEKHRREMEEALSELKPAILSSFEITYGEIDDEDWAESWKLHFHPVRVTEKIVVRPSWRCHEALEGEIVIDLDPGMAFGTGTHPSTALCIRLLTDHIAAGMRFLDIGTGSGILMITAAKTGAKTLAGIDCDPVAVEVAENNLLRNNISPDDFTLMEGDLVTSVTGHYDMIAANIVAETICSLVPHIPPLLPPGGIFITSGIIVEKEPMVLETLNRYGFTILDIRQREGWSAIAARWAGR